MRGGASSRYGSRVVGNSVRSGSCTQFGGLGSARGTPSSHPLELHGIRFDEGFRADFIVKDAVLVELISVEKVTKAHRKLVLTCLRFTPLTFSEALMSDGISRIINGEAE